MRHQSCAMLLCLLFSGVAQAAENTVDLGKAKALLEAGKAAEAYALLSPYEFYQAGDPDYDYLLGVTALDSGNFNAATLAFERVLAVNPNHAGARLDFARAYLALNDLDRAEEQFKIVLTQNPPANAKRAVDQYLERIQELRKAKNRSWVAYVEGVLGYDSNLTNVTRDFTNAVLQSYNLLGVQPTGNSIPRNDGYAGANAGVQYIVPVDDRLSWNASLDGKQREYFSERKFRSTTLIGQLGGSYKIDKDTYRLGVGTQYYLQQGDAATTPATALDNDVYSISGSWTHQIDPRTQLALFGQLNLIRYNDIPLSDTNAATIGAALTQSLALPMQPVVVGAAFHTRESARQKLSNGSDFSRDVVGIRLACQLSINAQWDGYALVGYQTRDDTSIGARKPGVYGQDTLTDATIGLRWKINKEWSLRPQIAYTDNHSNIPLYNTRRTDASLTLRREFR